MQTRGFTDILASMLAGTITTALTWLVVLLVPPVVGYWLAKIKSALARTSLLTLFLPAPAVLFTIVMFLFPPAPPDNLSWWMAGMIMISPVVIIWAMLAGTGYVMGRTNVRQATQ